MLRPTWLDKMLWIALASPAGRLHARILASVAEYETEVR
jgi:hypothetical protein